MRWAVPLVAGLCFCLSGFPAFAQQAQTLVGNTGQATASGSSPVFALQSMAMQFGTGASGGPWNLSAVRLEVKNWQSGVTPTVSLHAADGQLPGAKIATLTNPSPGTGSKTFPAPSGVTLQPGTTYTVVIESRSFSFNGFSLLSTESTAEDGGGAAGWQISDNRLIDRGSGWTVSTSNLLLKMAVLGHAGSNDATLGALTLADGGGNAIDLEPAFAAGTTRYTASVPHSVRALTAIATASDADATVSIASDDDASTPGSARLSLDVGENMVTVTVTSENGAATETYAVTVTRAAAPPAPDPTPSPQTLVGNTGQATASGSTPVFAVQSLAMQFGTGASGGPWNLSAVRLEVKNWQSGVTPVVSLHAADGQLPGAKIATLTNPSPGTGSKTFPAPSGVTLQPGTTYTVVIESRSFSFNGFSLLSTESTAEDGGGAAGWQISDSRLVDQGSGWTVSTSNLRLKLAILGTADPADATLGALTLADGEGNAIDLAPAFAADTTRYAASVAHAVSALDVTATAADADATVSIAGDDDAATPGSARLGLDAGENTVTITVTADDGATTETYTVAVTRPAAPPAPDPVPVPQTLVGNLTQPQHGSLGVHKDQRRAGIKFTTGNSATAWTLTAIQLHVTAWHPDVAPVVKLRRVSGPWPGTTIATLTNPSPGTGTRTFTPPSGLKLRPNTAYAVVVSAGVRAGRFSLGITRNNHEDSGSAAGWSIANASRIYESGAWSWRNRSLMVAVQGAAIADDATPDGLTGWFASAPTTHDGSSAFTVLVGFSEPITASRSAMRNHAIQVSGGRVTSAKRVERSGDLWEVGVAPTGLGAVTLTVEGARACGAAGAVCTSDGRALADDFIQTVPGPLALAVTDARAREGVNSHAIFSITLSRPSARRVTVEYATVDGTARVDEDYYARSGTATFVPGLVRFYLSIPVLRDAIDEGEETFTLTISNASGAEIADAEGTGTIVNSGPLPKGWLARFGRTVASQAVDAIGGRMEGGGSSHVTVGGQSLPLSGEAMAPDEREDVESVLMTLAETGDEPGGTSQGMTGREVLLGSSFHLASGGEAGGTAFTAWGQVATGGFDADVNDVRLDGSVTSGFLGADVGAADWLVGVALSVSEGDGSYTLLDTEDDDSGTIESSLTAFYPYARLSLSETVNVWGLVGYGTGALTLTQNPDSDRAKTYETDIGMRMGAVGARGEMVSPEELDGLTVALKSDAFWVQTSSDAVNGSDGNLAASEADVTRVRVLAEGSRSFATGSGTLTPSLELGLRNDGGDAETGTGIEAGASLRYAGQGFSVEGSVRTLVAHEASGYEEWGASGAVRIDPGASGRGLSLSVVPSWGAASSGVDRLWSLSNAGGLSSDSAFEAGQRLETEVGYGLCLRHTPGVLTPYAGLSLADGSGRAWRTGARWEIVPGAMLGLEATRNEVAKGEGAAPLHTLMLRGTARW